MIVTIIERVFTYNDIILTDINPNFSEQQVLNHYSRVYPELNNANIKNKGIINDKMTYSFEVLVGTKG